MPTSLILAVGCSLFTVCITLFALSPSFSTSSPALLCNCCCLSCLLLPGTLFEICKPIFELNASWMKLALALIPVILLMSIILSFRCNRTLNLPPGPWRWPFVGNLVNLGKLPHRDMHIMFEKYGPIVFLKLGSRNVVTTNDPEIIMEMFGKQDEVFASRPSSLATEYLCFNGEGLAFAPYGPHWKAMRRLCVEHLLSTKRMLSFRDQRREEAQSMVHEIWEQCKQGHVIQLREFLESFSMNCITRMIFGKRFFGAKSAGNEQASRFKQIMHEALVLLGVFNIGEYVPALRFFDMEGYEKRLKQVVQKVDQLQSEIMDECRKTRENQQGDHVSNFIDVLFTLRESGEERLTDAVMKAVVQDMIAAGTHTSAGTNEWTMAEILRHPRVLAKAREELDSVVGKNRVVDESDLNQLHYLRCVAVESMRLRPVGQFVVPHCSASATKLAGYDIPAKTQVLVNIYSHSRNPKVWGDRAEEFYPERHATDTKKIENGPGSDWKHLSFGLGKRRGPGAQLGMTLVLLALARLLHSFDWSLPEGMSRDDVDMTEVCGLTSGPATPFTAVATPRLPPHLYQYQLS